MLWASALSTLSFTLSRTTMNILIRQGRVINPATALDAIADIAIAAGRVVCIGTAPADFAPEATLDASGCIVMPGLVDLCARLRAPGQKHARMLESEMAAAAAGGITSLVCPPDTDPVLDEPGLVERLTQRARRLRQSRLYPLGALTRGLQGEKLAEMGELAAAGCIGLSQADIPIRDTSVLQRAMHYAATFGYTVWLHPRDAWLGSGIAASGALATRMGLSGVPVLAETIALMTIVELMQATGARVHLSRLSSAAGVELVRQAKQRGLPLSCDVSINSLHLTDQDIGFYDSRARLNPPLRQQADRTALRTALRDGTIDALVSDHNPVGADAKILPFAEAEPGATGIELLLALTLKWAQDDHIPLPQALAAITQRPGQILAGCAASNITPPDTLGQLHPGAVADICIWQPDTDCCIQPTTLCSQGQYTPFEGWPVQAQVRATLVDGRIIYRHGLPD